MSSQYKKIEYEVEASFGETIKEMLYIQYNATSDHVIVYDQYGNHLLTFGEVGFDMGQALTVAFNNFNDERLISISGSEFREIANKNDEKKKNISDEGLSELVDKFNIKITDLSIDGHIKENLDIEKYIKLKILKYGWKIPEEMYNEIISKNSVVILNIEYPHDEFFPVYHSIFVDSNIKDIILQAKKSVEHHTNLKQQEISEITIKHNSLYSKILKIKDTLFDMIKNNTNIKGINSTEFYKSIKEKNINIDDEDYSNAISSLIINKQIRAYYPNDSTEYFFQII